MNVLFLCTGNYYRSRFAEIYFNHLAGARGLSTAADSRGFEAWAGRNPGALSAHTIAYLATLNIPVPEPVRFPEQLTAADFERAQAVIALDETEHRPMMLRDFPELLDRVEFWLFPDTHLADPSFILPAIAERINVYLS